jgi:hypothetical protein
MRDKREKEEGKRERRQMTSGNKRKAHFVE